MSVVILIGRILFGLIFVGSGLAGHLGDTDGVVGYAESRGLKNSRILVQISGVLIAAAGLGVILGVWADLAALGGMKAFGVELRCDLLGGSSCVAQFEQTRFDAFEVA